MKKFFLLPICFALLFISNSFSEQSVFFPTATKNVSSDVVGGKASNLIFLEKIPEIKIPKWFCISSNVFYQHLNDLNASGLIKKLDDLCAHYKENEKQILEIGIEIQNAILSTPIRNDSLKEIEDAYKKLRNGKNRFSVSVRSSGVLEDLENSSFAGLYDTCLNQRNLSEVCKSIKDVWASSFNARLILKRAQAKIKQDRCLMAVVIQEMVQAKVAGVGCSTELSSNYPGIEICANYGIGDSVVSGESSVDKWLVHPTQNYVIKFILGNKLFHDVSTDDSRGVVHNETKNTEQNKPSLKEPELFRIANQIRTIRSYYNCEVDVEFAFDQDGILYILQARPLIKIQMKTLSILDAEDAKKHAVIASGDYSIPGIAQGRLKFIDRWEDLANKTLCIEPDDIVVTYVAINYWSHYLTQFKGLITKQGGATSHPILLCRERQVPCLIGIGNDFEFLRQYSGKKITLDGIGRKVYEGTVKLKKASSSDLIKAFETVKIRPWKPFTDRLFELKKGGHLSEFNGQYWLKNPSYPLKKLFREIYLKRSERLPILIKSHSAFKVESCIIDHCVCSLIEPAEQYIRCFNQMTLEECEQFCKNQEKNLQEYLSIVKNFKLDPIVWQQYVDSLSDLRSYIWVAEIFRMYADREAEILAANFGVPQYYFDECSSYIQSQLEEEDILMQEDIYKLASKIQKFCPNPRNISELKQNSQKILDEIETLAKNYRFSSNVAIETDLDLDIVYKRLLEEINQISKGKIFTTAKHTNSKYSYFPQIPELYQWLYLSIYNRILQSNSHHSAIRFQWNIRNELLRLGSYWTSLGKLKNPSDIFDLSSSEIKDLIRLWRNAGNE